MKTLNIITIIIILAVVGFGLTHSNNTEVKSNSITVITGVRG